MRNFYKSRKFHGSGCQHIHRLASSPLTLRPSAAAVAIPHHVAEPRRIRSISCTQSLIPWFEMNRPKSPSTREVSFSLPAVVVVRHLLTSWRNGHSVCICHVSMVLKVMLGSRCIKRVESPSHVKRAEYHGKMKVSP